MRSARIVAATATLALTALTAGCSFASPEAPETTPVAGIVTLDPGINPTPSASPSATPRVTPSAAPVATPEPTGAGAIVSAPKGAPVKPDIFLSYYDSASGEVRVVVNVPDIYETGGTCAVTMTDNSKLTTVNRKGESDVNGTACGQFVFNVTKSTSSSVDVQAHYASTGHEGFSETVKVDIS